MFRKRGNRPVRCGQAHPLNECPQLRLGQFRQPIEISKLSFGSGFSFIEPVTPICFPVYAERSTNCIAVLSVIKLVLAREDFYAFLQTAALDRNAEPEREVIDIDSALGCQQRLGAEDPEMTAAAGLFQRSVHSILLELPLQPEQGIQRSIEVGVNRDPL